MTATTDAGQGLPPFSQQIESPRHRWKVLAAGVLANAAFSSAFSGIPMTAVLMRSGYRLDNATLGLMLGLMSLGIALSELPWGLLTDRWGDRPVLLTGLGGTALALAAMALWAVPRSDHIPSLVLLGGALLLVGLLGGSVNGASGRAIMTWFSASERGLAMSIRQTAIPLGGAFGALTLPFVALHGGFSALYGLLAGLCVLAFALCAAWVHEPPMTTAVLAPSPAAASVSASVQAPSPAHGPLRSRRIWCMALGIGILCAPQSAVIMLGSVFLHDFVHATLPVISATMFIVQLDAMIFRVGGGAWTDRHRNRDAYLRANVAFAGVLFVLLAGLSWIGRDAAAQGALHLMLLVLLCVCGICISAWNGIAYTELAVCAGARHAGTALGMANTCVFVALFLTPASIPHLLPLAGWPLVWLVAALCVAIARPLLLSRTAVPTVTASQSLSLPTS